MGQAKRRGTYEERAAAPQGYPPRREWTEEERAEFVAKLKPSITKMVDGFRRSLFEKTPEKVKKKYPKPTGGRPCKKTKSRSGW